MSDFALARRNPRRPQLIDPAVCVACQKRPARTYYNYEKLPADQRKHFPRRPHNHPPDEWSSTAPASAPKKPTHFKPQTAEKIEVMAQRAERCEETTHPDDAGARPITAADYVQAFLDMCLRYDAPKGIEWVPKMNKWRCRPWWSMTERFHLGYRRNREDAIWLVRKWKELAEEIGPRKAMLKLRERENWGTIEEHKQQAE